MLTSLQNPLVKQMRKLHQAKERREQQLLLLEGTHLLEEACATGLTLETLCYTPAWQTHYPDLWQQAQQQAQRVAIVSPEVLQAIATTVNPDGVVATVKRNFLHPPPASTISLGIALETLQDPGNLGTVIRTAAAAAIDGLWISSDSVDLAHPKVLRATAGQWFRLPMVVSEDLRRDLTQLKATGVQVISTLPSAPLTYWEVDLTQPSLLLLGNEGTGLSPHLQRLADIAVRIPLATGVESLNVAIVAALTLYEARRQRAALL